MVEVSLLWSACAILKIAQIQALENKQKGWFDEGCAVSFSHLNDWCIHPSYIGRVSGNQTPQDVSENLKHEILVAISRNLL